MDARSLWLAEMRKVPWTSNAINVTSWGLLMRTLSISLSLSFFSFVSLYLRFFPFAGLIDQFHWIFQQFNQKTPTPNAYANRQLSSVHSSGHLAKSAWERDSSCNWLHNACALDNFGFFMSSAHFYSFHTFSFIFFINKLVTESK